MRFEIDAKAMGQIDRLHERAGLFAWRETYRDFARADLRDVQGALVHALESMPVALGSRDIAQCNELALFDAEFGLWHFIPSEGL